MKFKVPGHATTNDVYQAMANVMDPDVWACESLGSASVVLGVITLPLATIAAHESLGPPTLDETLFAIDTVSMILPFVIIGFTAATAAWRFGRDTEIPKVTWVAGLVINGLALVALAIAR